MILYKLTMAIKLIFNGLAKIHKLTILSFSPLSNYTIVWLNKNKQRDLLSKHMAGIITLIGDPAVVHYELCVELCALNQIKLYSLREEGWSGTMECRTAVLVWEL